MTFTGTNTYLLGSREVAVIDPGPDDPSHLDAIIGAIGPGKLTAIFVTHSHLDHAPLARPLADATGAPIFAAGNSSWGRSETMTRLAAGGNLGGGEGVDPHFEPDEQIRDGWSMRSTEWQITALETPGHMANHLSFAWNESLFSGDLVMGWATSVISPPDGDMTAFYRSLDRLMARADRRYYPGHGEPIEDPAARLQELYDHRRTREATILSALAQGPKTASELTDQIYHDIAPALIPMARRNVLAHLINLYERKDIGTSTPLTPQSRFTHL